MRHEDLTCRPARDDREAMNDPDFLSADQRMLLTATRLFKQQGIQSTGVDQIIDESGSARGTLYHHFGSKAGLLTAVLDAEGERWREWFFAELEAKSDSPQEKLLAIFDAAGSWFREKGYTGCLFMNAIAECRSQDKEIREATIRHKKLVKDRIRQIATDAGADNPSELTQQLDLLLDGLIITAMVTRSTRPLAHGKAAAEILINESLASVTNR